MFVALRLAIKVDHGVQLICSAAGTKADQIRWRTCFSIFSAGRMISYVGTESASLSENQTCVGAASERGSADVGASGNKSASDAANAKENAVGEREECVTDPFSSGGFEICLAVERECGIEIGRVSGQEICWISVVQENGT